MGKKYDSPVAMPTVVAEDLGSFDHNYGKPEHFSSEEWELGSWLSAALDDEKACLEFKEAINAWFDMIETRRNV